MTQTDEASPNGQQPQQDTKEERPCVYTMSGVLHYLQHEWSRHEIDKCRWDMERAELQARISFLQGERRGQENLKADLLRRIKMLEYCLKQERAKNYRLTHNGEDPPVYEEETSIPDILNQDTLHNLNRTDAKDVCGEYMMGRALLKQFLNEVGYSEKMLDVRNFRGPQNGPGHRLPTPPDLIKREDDSDSDDINGGKMDDDAQIVDSSFSFLSKEKTDSMESRGKNNSYKQSDPWSSLPNDILDRMKDRYLSDQHRRLHPEEEYDEQGKHVPKGKGRQNNAMANLYPELDITDIGLGDDPRDMDIKTNYDEEGDDPGLHQMKWTTKTTLRSHMDSVRAMQFHPVEPVLFTASDDGTIKMWNLDPAKSEKPNSAEGIEPVYTFRGHLGPVVCIDLSLSGDTLYSGGYDGAVCCWNVPSSNIDQHAAYDPKVLFERIKAHQDVIWSVVYHSSANRLVSAGADNVVKLWEPGNYSEHLIKAIDSPEGVGCPVSVDFVSTEPTQLLIAYQKFYACLVNIETAEVVRSFDFGKDEPAHLTRIISHPTMQITVVASADRKIRYFDNVTGQLMHSAVAHTDSVSSLSVDSNGLYLLSGSHDGSLRLWHMEKRVCLQEISAHRKKFDAAVMSVAFHPSRMIIGSTGADGLVKVFTTSSE